MMKRRSKTASDAGRLEHFVDDYNPEKSGPAGSSSARLHLSPAEAVISAHGSQLENGPKLREQEFFCRCICTAAGTRNPG